MCVCVSVHAAYDLLYVAFIQKACIKSLERIGKRTSVMTDSILGSRSDCRKHFSLMDDSCCYLLTRTWSNVPRGGVLKSFPLTLSILGLNEGPANQMR